jgi:nucleoside-diphosphate-sugar epimerase
MKIMVTGSKGYVWNLIKDRFFNDDIVEYDVTNNVCQDVHNTAYIANEMEGCQCVLHLAAFPHRDSASGWDAFRKLNVEGTQSVFRAATEARVPRMVYASSGNVYCFGDRIASQDGLTPPILLTDVPEPDRCHPYPRSKILAEQWLASQTVGPVVIALRINWIGSKPGTDDPWFGANISVSRLSEGIWSACRCRLEKKYEVVDLIELNPNYPGSIRCNSLLFEGA